MVSIPADREYWASNQLTIGIDHRDEVEIIFVEGLLHIFVALAASQQAMGEILRYLLRIPSVNAGPKVEVVLFTMVVIHSLACVVP